MNIGCKIIIGISIALLAVGCRNTADFSDRISAVKFIKTTII